MLISGIVKGKDGVILPYSSVIVTNREGKPQSFNNKVIGTKTRDDGTFSLDVPDSMLSDNVSDYLTARPSDNTYKVGKKLLLKSQKTYNFKLAWEKAILEQQEAIVVAQSNRTQCLNAGGVWVDSNGKPTNSNTNGKCWSKRKYDCVNSGGKWDGKKCNKGLSTFHKVLIGLGVLVVAVVVIYAYKNREN